MITLCPPASSVMHPPSLTGAILQTSTDYLRLILPISRTEYSIQALDILLKEYFFISLDFSQNKPYFCGRYFSNGHRSFDQSCIIGYNWDLIDLDKGELMLTLSGTALQRVKLPKLHLFCNIMLDLGAHCSRIDFACDDYTKDLFSLDNLQAASAAGNFSGCRAISTTVKTSGDGGWLVTFGQRSNARYCRFYNKSIESKGAIDSHRFEVEYKNTYASMIFANFCSLELDCVTDFVLRLLGGSIDFIDRSFGQPMARCLRLGWWSKFLSITGGSIAWAVPRIIRNIAKTIEWVKHKVAKSLVVIKKCFGVAGYQKWFTDVLTTAEAKLTSSHYSRIENYKLEYDFYL